MIALKIDSVELETIDGKPAYITGIKVNENRSPFVGYIDGSVEKTVSWNKSGLIQDEDSKFNLKKDDIFQEFVFDYEFLFEK